MSDREILLVGSIPLSDAEQVFRTVGNSAVAHRIGSLPDGETGPARSLWIECQIPVLLVHPQLESVEPDPDTEQGRRPARVPAGGIYSETVADLFPGKARLRDGVAPDDLKLDNLGYADWALESYESFSHLKREGVLPADLRFQVSLPSPGAAMVLLAAPGQAPVLQNAYRAGLFGEIERMLEVIPTSELAIQWDCVEPGLDYPGGREAVFAALGGLADGVPPEAELGYHLCYGDLEHKHSIEPDDLGDVVAIANHLASSVSRAISWVHMPVPRSRDDDRYFAPLDDLDVPATTVVALGLVHQTDGVDGTRRRLEAARRHLSDFAVATECGFGRRPPEAVADLLNLHATVADLATAP
ncbi:MAG: hypothetical protein JST08_09640 [Actinobacteria bacterium]|nr:hypothetical protein [Actinomycetota bacterium]